MDATSRMRKRKASQPGLMIAATAFCHGLTVVMRDVSDYERAGVPLLNLWRESPAGGVPLSP
jgi:toxin FitB